MVNARAIINYNAAEMLRCIHSSLHACAVDSFAAKNVGESASNILHGFAIDMAMSLVYIITEVHIICLIIMFIIDCDNNGNADNAV